MRGLTPSRFVQTARAQGLEAALIEEVEGRTGAGIVAGGVLSIVEPLAAASDQRFETFQGANESEMDDWQILEQDPNFIELTPD